MQFNLRVRLAIPASFAAVTIAILLGLFQVQGWKVPTPLAITFIVILIMMVTVAIGLMFFELLRAAFQFLEHRATTASWVSSEEPGLLDYEADGLRASSRFNKELVRLAADTQKLGISIQAHTKRIQDATKHGKPKLKQKRGNQAAKSIDRSAIFIQKRSALLDALVKDVSRNFGGLISASDFNDDADKDAARSFLATLEGLQGAVKGTNAQIASYRDSVRNLHERNLSRTVRISSKRLGDSLDDVLKILRRFQADSQRLCSSLSRKLDSS